MKKLLGAAALVAGACVVIFLQGVQKHFDDLTDDEVEDRREEARKRYNSEGGSRSELDMWTTELNARSNAKHNKENHNAKPYHREHGGILKLAERDRHGNIIK